MLHWWHPIVNRGLRTRFSDDLAWLPYITLFYVNATGDHALFDEQASFVTSRHLGLGDDEALVDPVASGTSGHHLRALRHRARPGAHGGIARTPVDRHRRLERRVQSGRTARARRKRVARILSLHDPRRDDPGLRASRRRRAGRCAIAIGARRSATRSTPAAGTASGIGEPGTMMARPSARAKAMNAGSMHWHRRGRCCRARHLPIVPSKALDAMERLLVDEPSGLIRLLTPPFDRTPHDPGYIKGYLPGIRENGGQYTHAALWAVRALAEAGRSERAAHLLDMLNPVLHGDTRGTRRQRTRSNPTSSRRMCMAWRRTSVAAAGRGTPVRRVGCFAWHWNRCWA